MMIAIGQLPPLDDVTTVLPFDVRDMETPVTPPSIALTRDVFLFSISSGPMNTALVTPFWPSSQRLWRPFGSRDDLTLAAAPFTWPVCWARGCKTAGFVIAVSGKSILPKNGVKPM